jgi:Protein of unknown function (DUF2752)
MPDRNRRLKLAALLAMGLAGIVLLRLYDPANSSVFPPCPLHYLTGFYCPGCGSLRAIHQLLHGNLQAAWAMNPLSVLLFPYLAYGLASEMLFQLRGQRLPQFTLPGVWIRALCAVIILFGIMRNLPLHPFNLLAPGARLHL